VRSVLVVVNDVFGQDLFELAAMEDQHPRNRRCRRDGVAERPAQRRDRRCGGARSGPQVVGTSNHKGSGLIEAPGPLAAGGAFGHHQRPDGLHCAIPAPALASLARQGGPGCALGVEGVGLARAVAFLAIRTVHLGHLHAGGHQIAAQAGAVAYRLVVSGTRVFVDESDGSVDEFSVTTGKCLWHLRYGSIQTAASGKVYGTINGTYESPGPLQVIDPATKSVLWSDNGDAFGMVMVAGTHLINIAGSTSGSFPVAGCGGPVCNPPWVFDLPDSYNVDFGSSAVGADHATLFVTWTSTDDHVGFLYKVNASTGKVGAIADLPSVSSSPARGGNVVWVLSHSTLYAFSADGTGTA
jgi:hypothetical protein